MSGSSSGDPFDEKAATWDEDPSHVERAAIVAERVAEAVPLDRSMRVLEYGAGTALVAQALRDQVGPLTLVDTSQGMRDVINSKIEAGRLGDAKVWDFDLSDGQVPAERFDLIITVLTLHHVSDLERVLVAFAQMLAPSGRLCVVDLDKEDGSFHGEGFGGHHGFDRDALAKSLQSSGFGEVDFTDCHYIVRDDANYPMFLATAQVVVTA
ncbi:MAG TPA: class I SAM-dependent methyltransferase [Microthrixaceae bacterium]|nr:class I SAM-dependent methyltransferase [Microthrixaceae bacterium]